MNEAFERWMDKAYPDWRKHPGLGDNHRSEGFDAGYAAARFLLERAEKLEHLRAKIGQYAVEKGEAWRIGEGAEIMDAYQAVAEVEKPRPDEPDNVEDYQ